MNAIGSEALFASATLITIFEPKFEPNSMIFSNQGYCPICCQDAIFTAIIQQRGGELDAADRVGQKNWLHVGSAKSGPQGRGDSVGGGILPSAGCAGQRVSASRPARNESKETFGSRCGNPSPLEV